MNLLSTLWVVFRDTLKSGWSFFFRWPNMHPEHFRPEGLFVGPWFQGLVFLVAADLALHVLHIPPHFAIISGFLALSLLTGFFHEDGLADTCDGLGVPSYSGAVKQQERIAEATKDSRLGTYGVSALVLFWLFRFLIATEFAQQTQELHIHWTFFAIIVASRSVGLTVYCLHTQMTRKKAPAGLSHHVLGSLSRKRLNGSVGLLLSSVFLLAFLWNDAPFALVYACSHLFCLALLRKLERRGSPIGGDAIGFCICLIEIILFLLLLDLNY